MDLGHKSAIAKRIDDTITERDKLLKVINDLYGNRWFTRKCLSEKIAFIKESVLRTYLSQFKREGLLYIKNRGSKNWTYKPTKELALKLRKLALSKKVDSYYLDELPDDCICMRGYLRSVSRGVHLIIYSGALANRVRTTIFHHKTFRHLRYFFVTPFKYGNKLIPKLGGHSVDSSIPKQLVYDDEMLKLRSNSAIPVEIYLKPSDWSLTIDDFFTENKFTRDLVKTLSKKFRIDRLPPHNYSVAGLWRFDILLNNAVIEVTASDPKRKPGPHSPQSSVIRSKILDAFLYSLEKHQQSFVILPKSWHEKRHIRDLADVVKKYGCNLIFTDFKYNWADRVAAKIESVLKSQD